ncbi:hypothetical protein ElyMa_006400000, partial [Elysia marginata]
MSLNQDSVKDMFLANNNPRRGDGDHLTNDHTGQQLHVSGVFIILLEIVLVVENLFPILVVALWLPPPARGVGDRLVAAFSVTCILSALVPTPLGLASYFSGGWYGGAPTCTTYQVTSIWCNLSSLVLLTYICVNCHIAVRRLVRLKPPDRCPSCQRSVLAPVSVTQCGNGQISREHGQEYDQSSNTLDIERGIGERIQHQLQPSEQQIGRRRQQEMYSHCNVETKPRQKLSLGEDSSALVLGYAENSLVDLDSESDISKIRKKSSKDTTIQQVPKSAVALTNGKVSNEPSEFAQSSHSPAISIADFNVAYSLPIQNSQPALNNSSLSLQQVRNDRDENHVDSLPSRTNVCSSLDNHYGPESQSSILGAGECHSRDYVSLVLFFLFSMTLGISSMPVAGLGPDGMPQGDSSCRSWLVPTPVSYKERVFFMTFLTLVYLCLLMGCGSGICVCLQLMLTLQKAGVEVSEPTLMYSNIATSLPGLLNPLLYSLALARYRTGYKALIEKCCCKRRKLKPHPMK